MKYLHLFIFLALSAACDRSGSGHLTKMATPAPPSAETTPLQGRLAAAKSISDDDARYAALRTLSLDAANAGNSEIVLGALRAIKLTSTKDRTAEECALILAKAPQPKAANDVAGLISSTEMRDRTLKTIAEGR